jgi:hypothetical protein
MGGADNIQDYVNNFLIAIISPNNSVSTQDSFWRLNSSLFLYPRFLHKSCMAA